MSEDQGAVLGALSVVVRCPALDVVEQHVGRCTQKDDRVEVEVEPSLVRDRSRHEERHLALPGEKLGDAIFPPDEGGLVP
jgi:hypothetical protein